jgi:hypothetical protein
VHQQFSENDLKEFENLNAAWKSGLKEKEGSANDFIHSERIKKNDFYFFYFNFAILFRSCLKLVI